MTYNWVREQITPIAAEAAARAPETGTPNRKTGSASGSRGAQSDRALASRRHRSRSGRDSARAAAAAGLAKNRVTASPNRWPADERADEAVVPPGALRPFFLGQRKRGRRGGGKRRCGGRRPSERRASGRRSGAFCW